MATRTIIRIELRGQPGGDTYKQLHSYMTEELRWETSIVSDTGIRMPLPSATYSGERDGTAVGLATLLRDHIIANIWQHGARVLVIDWSAWGEATTTPW